MNLNFKQIRCSKHFYELIEQVKAKEAERGNINCPNPTATEIIYFDYTHNFPYKFIKKIESDKNKVLDFKTKLFIIEEKGISDAEHYATGYFKEKGFRVKFTKNKEIKKLISSKYSNIINALDDIIGRPDLIILKDDYYYFVEVKTKDDGLNTNQLKWMIRNPNVEVIIFYLNQNGD